jgi:hypothetical protein
MDKVLIVVLGAAGVAALLFVAIILSTLFGGIAGWVVGAIFPFVTDTIRDLSGTTLTNFQIGAVLGFVGSFLKSSSSSSS